MKNPRLTVTIYTGCDLTEDELVAVHRAAVAALPERVTPSVSGVRQVDVIPPPHHHEWVGHRCCHCGLESAQTAAFEIPRASTGEGR